MAQVTRGTSCPQPLGDPEAWLQMLMAAICLFYIFCHYEGWLCVRPGHHFLTGTGLQDLHDHMHTHTFACSYDQDNMHRNISSCTDSPL